MHYPSLEISDSAVAVTRLRTQFEPGLLGVPAGPLAVSWASESLSGEPQVAYQLSTRATGETSFADADPVAGSVSVGVDPGLTLAPREGLEIRVRVATSSGWSAWSDHLAVEAGIDGDALVADVIGLPSAVEGPVPHLRTVFAVDDVPEKAILRLSALGLVDCWINGRRATDAVLTPGWTSYHERILVDTLDVRELLRPGANVIVLSVGDGWYRGRVGFKHHTKIYGEHSGALAQLETERGVIVSTDDSWRAEFGEVLAASLYDGSTIDLRRRNPAIHDPDFDDSAWQRPHKIDVDKSVFRPRAAPPVRVVEELPMELSSAPGAIRLDSGQNIAGWVRLTVSGRAGDTVSVRHAEVLEPDGSLHTAALRTAKATDTYILPSDGEHQLEPVFTYHGFRYGLVTGDATVLSATALAISSDLPIRSAFECSDADLNTLHSNVLWSARGNFVSLPTDCPQRDERLGWTGDAQVFAATACTVLDSEMFWSSWLEDLVADQAEDGGVASVVPDILRPAEFLISGAPSDPLGRAGWADAATIVPLAVYESFGDPGILRRQLPSMRAWVGWMLRRVGADGLLPEEPFQYGDWLDPDAPADRPWEAKVPGRFVANCYFARSALLLSAAERVVGDAARAAELEQIAGDLSAAIWSTWGATASQTQTGAAMLLEFRIAPAEQRARVAEGLAASVRRERGRISTGFLGTPLILFALSNAGHDDEAYAMLLRREVPSWLYQVEQGATTVWERWDAICPDGSIHGGEMDTGGGHSMVSFNHYAYGAVVDWMYRTIAGLSPVQSDPGYQTIRIAPRPAVDITSARATIDTRLGTASIDWRLTAGQWEADVLIPSGARVELDLPTTPESVVSVDGNPGAKIGPGMHRLVVTRPRLADASRALSRAVAEAGVQE